MTLPWTLTRTHYLPEGILSILMREDRVVFCALEHAYPQPDGTYAPKIPPGTYTCTRRFSPKHQYEVFEVENVPGHSNCELHIGNYQEDSDGCILVGESFGAHQTMVCNSFAAFLNFMEIEEGTQSFTLNVVA